MILLDTSALIWLDRNHQRTRGLGRYGRLYASPASALELQFLLEAGRVRLRAAGVPGVPDVMHASRFAVDDPPADAWFTQALDIGWTRDPFDRLLVAHARLRGWRIATADTTVLEHLPSHECLAL